MSGVVLDSDAMFADQSPAQAGTPSPVTEVFPPSPDKAIQPTTEVLDSDAAFAESKEVASPEGAQPGELDPLTADWVKAFGGRADGPEAAKAIFRKMQSAKDQKLNESYRAYQALVEQAAEKDRLIASLATKPQQNQPAQPTNRPLISRERYLKARQEGDDPLIEAYHNQNARLIAQQQVGRLKGELEASMRPSQEALEALKATAVLVQEQRNDAVWTAGESHAFRYLDEQIEGIDFAPEIRAKVTEYCEQLSGTDALEGFASRDAHGNYTQVDFRPLISAMIGNAITEILKTKGATSAKGSAQRIDKAAATASLAPNRRGVAMPSETRDLSSSEKIRLAMASSSKAR